MLKKKLNQIRPRSDINITVNQKILRITLIFLFGAVLGFIAKYFDSISIIGDIGTHLGIWIMIATLISVWSRSPMAAALHVLSFFVAMLIAYYAYSMVLFGFFPKRYFIGWGFFALVSPICAYIAWYAKGDGWISGFCASLPISLLLLEGYSFYYTFSIAEAFDLFAAVVLFIILTNKINQRLQLLLFTETTFYIFWKINIISLLFGGL